MVSSPSDSLQKEENVPCRGPATASRCGLRVARFRVPRRGEPWPPHRAQPRPGAWRKRLPTFREDPGFTFSEGVREVYRRVGGSRGTPRPGPGRARAPEDGLGWRSSRNSGNCSSC